MVGQRAPGARRKAGARAAVALAILAGAAGRGCQSSPAVDYVNAYNRIVCKRIFECCLPADVKLQTAGTDAASCAAKASSPQTAEIVNSGLFRFDDAAAQRCLADLEQLACPALFAAKFGGVVPCNDVFTGALALGQPCDEDAVCASSDCEGQMCVVRPPQPCDALSCAADEFCGGQPLGCQKRAGVGASCVAAECAVGLTCTEAGRACAAPAADGEVCGAPYDCVNTCSIKSPLPNAPTGTCRPGICQGS